MSATEETKSTGKRNEECNDAETERPAKRVKEESGTEGASAEEKPQVQSSLPPLKPSGFGAATGTGFGGFSGGFGSFGGGESKGFGGGFGGDSGKGGNSIFSQLASKPSIFGAPKAAATSKDEGDDNQYAEIEEADVEVKPIVKLQPVEVDNGEKEDEKKFEVRCTLYILGHAKPAVAPEPEKAFEFGKAAGEGKANEGEEEAGEKKSEEKKVSEDKKEDSKEAPSEKKMSWQNLGVGKLRVNKNSAGKTRIVMRAEQTLKLMLNSWFLAETPCSLDGNHIRLTAFDGVDRETNLATKPEDILQVKSFLIRLKERRDAAELFDCLEQLKRNPEKVPNDDKV